MASTAGEGQWVQVRRYSLQGRSLPPVAPLLPLAHAPRTLLICLFIIYPQPASQKAPRHLLKSCSPKLGCAPGSLGLQARTLPRGLQVPLAQPGSQGPPDPTPKGGLSHHPCGAPWLPERPSLEGGWLRTISPRPPDAFSHFGDRGLPARAPWQVTWGHRTSLLPLGCLSCATFTQSRLLCLPPAGPRPALEVL